jgi:hypothetical protein
LILHFVQAPVSPERVAEVPETGNSQTPLKLETEEEIGAEGQSRPDSAPAPVRDSPLAEQQQQPSEKSFSLYE